MSEGLQGGGNNGKVDLVSLRVVPEPGTFILGLVVFAVSLAALRFTNFR